MNCKTKITAYNFRQIFKAIKKCYCSTHAAQISSLTNADVRAKRNQMFEKELLRQASLVTRVEKIQVEVKGPPQECTLMMNKNLSIPYHCAKHIGELAMKRSVIALVNGKLWDMNRPLPEDCQLQFLHFKQEDPYHVNKAYWRSCSFVLGWILDRAFKDNIFVELHSWPSPNVRSGSFVYDVDLKMKDWKIQQDELRVLSIMAWKLAAENLKFEYLQVDADLALKMFEDNRFKKNQIPQIASKSVNGSNITLYRLGDHIDISYGPMIAHTGYIGRFAITAAHLIENESGHLHRFQGISLPQQLRLNPFAFKIIEKRAASLNTTGISDRNVPLSIRTAAIRSS